MIALCVAKLTFFTPESDKAKIKRFCGKFGSISKLRSMRKGQSRSQAFSSLPPLSLRTTMRDPGNEVRKGKNCFCDEPASV